ncbi:MAG: Na+/H+ antiporter NhaA [Sphingomonadales bacterium]|nr:Na+/H+ antiporter NhaA [Sphingomonadales bacterium]MDE2568135.1 Na+/H+ antiporter NhaA [Sphingomonadales bacterium]
MLAKAKISRSALAAFLSGEAAPGVVLMIAAAAAMAMANSGLAEAYHQWFHHTLAWTPIAKLDTLHLWINDALMVVFFFVVGLEIKREIVDGELSDPNRRRLPVIAAAAGMVAPALIFLFVARLQPMLHRGWAIPAATDIAFAMGVLALLGNRLPPSIRLFLLTVAIVDDLGAVAVIALFYSSGIKAMWLAVSLAILAGMIALNYFRWRSAWPYVIGAVLLWFAVLHSGVHATVAGVLAAFTVPLALDSRRRSPLLRLEHALVKPNGFLIVPLFGFANAGVAIGGDPAHFVATLPAAIALGLFLGKQLGIFAAIWSADRLGVAPRPEGASWMQLWGMALLCGIGFTMSLFIAALAYPMHQQLVEEAKIGVLAGSVISALAGWTMLRFARPAKPAED